MHVNLICRVERYDPKTGVGDLAPLFNDDKGNPLPKIINARALRMRLRLYKDITLEGGTINHSPITSGETSHSVTGGNLVVKYDDTDHMHNVQEVELWPHYSPGDIVFAAVPDYDLSDAITGRQGNGDSKEPHELTSAVILGLVGGV